MASEKLESVIEQISLKLEDGREIKGFKCGDGPIPCLIVGPGSFYLKKVMQPNWTLYAFDGKWSHKKGESIETNEINKFDFNYLITEINTIVQALKKHYNYKKVGLMGFSAPGLLALGAAAIGGMDIAFVIGSGIASSRLDPEFKDTNVYFQQHADLERKNRFEQDSKNFEALTSGGESGKPLLSSKFTEEIDKNTHKKTRRLTPNSQWTEFVRSLTAKQVFDYKDKEVVAGLINDWQFNPAGEVMSEDMRQQFFGKILSQIDPKKLYQELIKSGIPFMSVYGEYDFTTPPPKDDDVTSWSQNPNFFFKRYMKSVHYPSWEPSSKGEFNHDAEVFFRTHKIMDLFVEHKSNLTY